MDFYRRVLRIKATDSPNVRLFIAQMRSGQRRPDAAFVRNVDNAGWALWSPEEFRLQEAIWRAKGSPDPPEEILVPGVLTFSEYKARRLTWDRARQSVGLDAQFWVGPQLLLFPPSFLQASEALFEALRNRSRVGRSLGVDPAQGSDKTAWAVVDEHGLIELLSMKTPDTSIIPGQTAELGRKWHVPPENWIFDRGCGLEHADRLRKQGFRGVRTVGFGEGVLLDPKRAKRLFPEKLDQREERDAYRKRRDQMYGEASLLCDPTGAGDHLLPSRGVNTRMAKQGRTVGFALPPAKDGEAAADLLFQLSKIPRAYDEEGRLKLPPKNRATGKEENEQKTLTELIGHSPDEADALVLAVHGLLHKPPVATAGV